MSVTVVVPTRNNLAELRACLASLERQTVAPDRVLVCVDGSTDGTLEFLHGLDASSKVVALTHDGNAHRGRSATRNLALPHLSDGFVLFLDSDMRLADQAIEAHLGVATARDAISIGAVVYENAAENPWAGYLMRRGRNRYADGASMPFTQFTTQNALVTAESFVAVGGFDERMVEYGGEDLELAIRLLRHTGGQMVNNPHAEARTIEPKTWPVAMAQFRRYGETNLPMLMETHPDVPPTFELGRIGSRRWVDRAFVWAAVNRLVATVATAGVRYGPEALRVRLLNYLVIRSVYLGYLSRTPS